MNREIKRFLLLAVIGLASASGLLAQSAEKPLFILGTVEGRNTTDPRPAESTNFRTLRGGFQVIQGFAGYVAYEIKRITQNSGGVLFLSYVAKVEQISEERRKSWVSILRDATLVTVDNGTARKY